jgi:hypothetical protein
MTDTDLRTAAAAFEADLSEYCDGPLRDALRAALAQSEHNKKVDDWGATLPPQSDGWQPIETAPKDGTPILCGFPDNFHAQHGHFDDNTGKWGQLISFYYQPTHWMPLPAPPEATPAPTAAIEGASDGPALDTWTQEEMDAADHTAKERFEKLRPIFEADNGPVESGPALKCPNPDCMDGYINLCGDDVQVCPTCHREKP